MSLTAEQVAQVKARMREDPEVKHLCKVLGVTMDEFLKDIEQQGEVCTLHDARTPEERAAGSLGEIMTAAKEGFAEASRLQRKLQGRDDARGDARQAHYETSARLHAGGAKPTEAPRERGRGAVIVAEPDLDAERVRAQVHAGRLRTRTR